MRVTAIIIGICAATAGLLSTAQAQQAYWIYFTDKQHTPYTISTPQAFLSQASIERRTKDRIAIRTADLPVDPAYVEQIRNLGLEVRTVSKWLNAVSVVVNEETPLSDALTLTFVASVSPVQRYTTIPEISVPADQSAFYRTADNTVGQYGGADNQNRMIGVDFLHGMGYRGQGVKIAVLDGGFYGVDWGAGFESVRAKDQIKEVFNVPDNNTDVYISSTHGSNVLSIMAVDEPGVYVGSAPDAEYFLFRTEVTSSEYVVEEDYWLAAAEYADSIGADIINSSLGYTTFDDPTQDHTYADMDGNTTVVTRAADMAAAAGILVVNSAGNSGDDDWNFIGAPADGDSVFTIGAVDANGNYAAFSSEGPTSDGRIKPNVVGQGAGAAVMTADGVVGYGSGTSYSSPLIAGACASLMSAFPELTNMQVIEIVQSTASKAANPDYLFGYGIPSFARAYLETADIQLPNTSIMHVLPNPADDEVTVYITGVEQASAALGLFDMSGKMIAEEIYPMTEGGLHAVRFTGLDLLASGVYFLRLTGDAYTESKLIAIQ